jgi:hypothetical protein
LPTVFSGGCRAEIDQHRVECKHNAIKAAIMLFDIKLKATLETFYLIKVLIMYQEERIANSLALF